MRPVSAKSFARRLGEESLFMIAYRYLERGITGLGRALLAGKGIAAHREHFVRLRSLPVFDGKLGKLIKSDIDPISPDY